MGRALGLREDFTAADLKRLARESRDADQTRRLLALAVIYDGGSRAEAAETGRVGRQIVRDWVVRFNAEGPEGLVSRKPPGNPSKLSAAQRAELARLVERGPIPAGRPDRPALEFRDLVHDTRTAADARSGGKPLIDRHLYAEARKPAQETTGPS